MTRFLLTLAITLGLYAAQQAYVYWVTPWTVAVERPQRAPEQKRVVEQPPEVQALTNQHLTHEAWIRHAKIRYQQSDNAYLFADTVHPAENKRGDTIRMAPFALIVSHPQDPDAAPFTVVAAAARVRFENQFFDPTIGGQDQIDFMGDGMGRLMGVTLEGQVHITGPDGLVIDGHDFTFQEESAQLYSDHPIFFRYGPSTDSQATVRGSSEKVVIDFQPASSSPFGGDMPRVEEMPRSIQLSSRVVMDFTTEEKGQNVRTRVTSQGPFTFNFQTRLGRFVDEVHVARPTGENELDEIACHELQLQFGEEVAPPSAGTESDITPASAVTDSEASFLRSMPLLEVRAKGRPSRDGPSTDKVILRSAMNGLRAELDELILEVQQRLVTLIDAQSVIVTRRIGGDSQTFSAPRVELLQAADETLEMLIATGPGEFRHVGPLDLRGSSKGREAVGVATLDDDVPPDLWATWTDRLVLQPLLKEDLTQLTIQGDVTIRQADQMQVSARTVTAWTDSLEELAPLDSASHRKAKAKAPPRFPLHRVQASGNVSFVTATVVGRRIQVADITFQPGRVAPPPPREKRVEAASATGTPENFDPSVPFVFECGRLQGTIVNDADTQRSAVREMHGFEGIQLTRELPPELGGAEEIPFDQLPVRLTAREFSATNADGVSQVLTLRGVVDDEGHLVEPVEGHIGDFSLTGPVMVLDRQKNLVTLIGESGLGFPVERDFSGNMLLEPATAHIACVERIEFNGQKATFLQSVKATVLDNLIRSESLTANLTQRIDFSAARPDTRGIKLATIECRDNVSLEMYQRDAQGKNFQEILIAEMTWIEINQTTGQFDGLGKGVIKDWRKAGTRRVSVQPRSAATSNRPANTNRDYEWEYVGITFHGAAKGNLNDRWGTLNDRVEVIHAPVKNVMELFHRNQLSSDAENAAQAVYIKCDQLRVSLEGGEPTAPGKSPEAEMATVDAFGRAELETQKFYARAHLLKYQQANEMFTLSGKGQENASLGFRESDGSSREPFRSLKIQYVPSRQELTVDGAQTIIGVAR